MRIARPQAEQIDELIQHLERRHQVDPATIQVARAPLRICPLGAHIDHQLGRVTGMTIDRSILLAFAPTPDGSVYIESLNFEGPVSFKTDAVPPYRRNDWGNYVRGAALALQRSYPVERGLIGVISGSMPIGGLSSSAAVTVAYLLALEATNQLDVSPKTNISLVRYTENEYIGLDNGILDQSVILCSQPNHLTLIDCQSLEIDQIPTPLQPGDFDILVVYSGVTHVLVGTDYNSRVAECQEAARLLLSYGNGVEKSSPSAPRLRQVDPAIFAAEGHRLPEPLRKRAAHYFGEMERVVEGVAAWQAGDLANFGHLINQSGESSIKYYQSGSPQLITLYEILRNTPGVYGARFSGAGFRGSCIALIDPAARDAIAKAIHQRYPVEHPDEAAKYSIHCCRPGDRARLLT